MSDSEEEGEEGETVWEQGMNVHSEDVRRAMAVLENLLRGLAQLPWLGEGWTWPVELAAIVTTTADIAAKLPLAKAEAHAAAAACKFVIEGQDSGAFCLKCAVALLQGRLQAAEHWHSLHQQQEQHSAQRARTEPPASAATAVLSSSHLCKAILSYIGPGAHLFVAGVSRGFRAHYLAAVAETSRILYNLFATYVLTATESLACLRLAVRCGLGGDLLSTRDTQEAIGASASLEMANTAIEAGLHPDGMLLVGAARWLDMPLLQELRRVVGRDSISLCHWLEVGVKCVERAGGAGNSGSGCADVSRFGEVLSWLSQQVPEDMWLSWYSTGLCSRAARDGHIPTLEWLLRCVPSLFGPIVTSPSRPASEHSGPFRTCFPATSFSLQHPLHRPLRGYSVLDAAAHSGHRHVLKLLRSRSHAWGESTATAAAAGGQMAVLQWLRAAGCPFNTATVRGHRTRLAQLEWLWQDGLLAWGTREQRVQHVVDALTYPWNWQERSQWLLRHGAEWPSCGAAALVEYRTWKPARALFAVENGCPWGEWTSRTCQAVRDECHASARDFHAAGCPCECVDRGVREGVGS